MIARKHTVVMRDRRAKNVRACVKAENDFRDAEAIAKVVRRPKFRCRRQAVALFRRNATALRFETRATLGCHRNSVIAPPLSLTPNENMTEIHTAPRIGRTEKSRGNSAHGIKQNRDA